MDVLGVLVIAIVTAVGGGTIRDVLLDRYPVFWIEDPAHVVVSVIAAAITIVYARIRRPPTHTLAVADALGLALFTVVGAQIAERAMVHPIVIVVMGTITGVAGGVIRDVLSAEIPIIFRKGELYATAAIAGVTLYLLAEASGIPRQIAAFAGTGAIISLRLASIFWGLHLPVPHIRDD